MSDQLTWEGLLPEKPAKKTKAKTEARKADPDIEARINRLIEAKNNAVAKKSESVAAAQAPIESVIVETKIQVQIEEEIIVEEVAPEAAPEIFTVSNVNRQIKTL